MVGLPFAETIDVDDPAFPTLRNAAARAANLYITNPRFRSAVNSGVGATYTAARNAYQRYRSEAGPAYNRQRIEGPERVAAPAPPMTRPFPDGPAPMDTGIGRRGQYMLRGARARLYRKKLRVRTDPFMTVRKVDAAESYSASQCLYVAYDDVCLLYAFKTIAQNILEMVFRKLKSPVKYIHEVPACMRIAGGGNDHPDQPISNQVGTIQFHFSRDDSLSHVHREDFGGTGANNIHDKSFTDIVDVVDAKLLQFAKEGYFLARISCIDNENKILLDLPDLEYMKLAFTATTVYKIQNITKGLDDNALTTSIGANPLTGFIYSFSRPGIRVRDAIRECLSTTDQDYLDSMRAQQPDGRIDTENLYQGDYALTSPKALIPPFGQPPIGRNTFSYLKGTFKTMLNPGKFQVFYRPFKYYGTLKKFMESATWQTPRGAPTSADRRLAVVGSSFMMGLEHGIRGETKPNIELQVHRDMVFKAKVRLTGHRQIPAANTYLQAYNYV